MYKKIMLICPLRLVSFGVIQKVNQNCAKKDPESLCSLLEVLITFLYLMLLCYNFTWQPFWVLGFK